MSENNNNSANNVIDLGEFHKKEKKSPIVWLSSLVGPGHLDQVKASIEPIWDSYILKGICSTFHGSASDEVAQYLESRKKDGEITYHKFCGRYDYSCNHYINQTKVEYGHWILSLDILEVIEREFLDIKLEALINSFEQNFIDAVYLHGKIFFFKVNDFSQFSGALHPTLMGVERAIELTKIPTFANSEEYFHNTRPKYRDKYHFVMHYGRYYLFADSSRHMMHGIQRNVKPNQTLQEVVVEREIRRREVKQHLRNLGIAMQPEAVLEYLRSDLFKNDFKMKGFVNKEKILNDIYRLYVLDRKDFEDDHDWSNMVVIE